MKRKLMSWFLAAVFMLSVVPFSAYANEVEPADTSVVSDTDLNSDSGNDISDDDSTGDNTTGDDSTGDDTTGDDDIHDDNTGDDTTDNNTDDDDIDNTDDNDTGADNTDDSDAGDDDVIVTALEQPVVTAENVASTGKPRLTWEAVEGAVEYLVYVSTEKNGTYDLIDTTAETKYTHAEAKVGTVYYYQIAAVSENPVNNSEPSDAAEIICRLPETTITSATNVTTTGKPSLSWEPVEGAVKYMVYRSTEKNGVYTRMYTTSGTSYTNTLAKAGVTYFYKIVAVAENEAANSVMSAAKQRTCDCAQPVITAISGKTGKPYVSWNAVDGAIQYKIYRSTSLNGTYSLMYATSGTSYTNTKATVGMRYYYKVRAISENSGAHSVYSEAKSAKCIKNSYSYIYSSYSVTKPNISSGAQTNITLACKAINGTILMPGEEFSFNEVVGSRSASKGYQLASVYAGGQFTTAVGGGVCQVATAMYNVALEGNLKITKRYQHSVAPTYGTLGRDATVYRSSKDIRFVNNTNYCIKIKAVVSGGTAKITLLTRESGVSPEKNVIIKVSKSNGVYKLSRKYNGVVNYTATTQYK